MQELNDITVGQLLYQSITEELPFAAGGEKYLFGIQGQGFDPWCVATGWAYRGGRSGQNFLLRSRLGLESSTALSSPSAVLIVPDYGADKSLFGQPQLVENTLPGDSKVIALSILRYVTGENLYRFMEEKGAGAWEALSQIPQGDYTHLMEQLKLARELGHSFDALSAANIMVNPATSPAFTIVDLGYNRPQPTAQNNSPELLIRLFFPRIKGHEAQEVHKQTVLEKLLVGAEAAQIGAPNIEMLAQHTLGLYNLNSENPEATSLSETQKAEAAARLCRLPQPVILPGAIRRDIPQPHSQFGELRMDAPASKLLSLLHEVASARNLGRNIPQM